MSTEWRVTSAPVFLLGRCDECQSLQTFTSERAKELWLTHHTHDQGQSGESFSDD